MPESNQRTPGVNRPLSPTELIGQGSRDLRREGWIRTNDRPAVSERRSTPELHPSVLCCEFATCGRSCADPTNRSPAKPDRAPREVRAPRMGFEPTPSSVTGKCSDRLSYLSETFRTGRRTRTPTCGFRARRRAV